MCASWLPVVVFGVGVFAAAAPSRPSIKPLDPILAHNDHYYLFSSRQDIQAPVWDITIRNASAVTPGYWFIAPYEIKTQTEAGEAWVGPHIYDGQGHLVWSGTPAFGHWNVFDFDSVDVNGEPHLTGLDWHGQRGVLLDSSYQLKKTAPSVASSDTFQNMHGFAVIDNGARALVQTVKHWEVPAEVTFESVGYRGKCDANYEGFRELDLQSPGGARVIFDWDARKISLNESTYLQTTAGASHMCRHGWDLLHVNAVSKFPDGDYLLSARHTDALYKISHIDGEIVWRLGGVRSSFKLGDGARFSRQHHARCLEQNETHTLISLFDNAVGEHYQRASRTDSRGLVLVLDTERMTADVLRQYEDPQKQLTDGRGSFQVLPNGNAFINWAKSSRISEHSSEGEVIMEARLTAGIDTYRAFKHPWVGRPTTPPDLHAEVTWREDQRIVTVISMSWNGATEHTQWTVKGLNAQGEPIVITSNLPRTGFETAIEYEGFATNVYAEALDAEGKVLGTSEGSGRMFGGRSGGSDIPTRVEIGVGSIAVGVLLAMACASGLRHFRRLREDEDDDFEEKGVYSIIDQKSDV